MKKYIIIDGAFRRDDNSEAGIGEEIELADDVATLHSTKLRAVVEEPKASSPADGDSMRGGIGTSEQE